MDQRRLERGHEAVHVIERSRAFDPDGELMILIRVWIVRPPDHLKVHERHQNLAVIHEAAQGRDLSGIAVDRLQENPGRRKGAGSQHHRACRNFVFLSAR